MHLWSLAIEEQFYLVWPFALWLLCRSGRHVLIPVALAVGLSFLFDFGAGRIDPVTTFYLPHARAWELLTGAMLSLVQGRRRAAERAGTRLIREVSSVAGLGLLLGVFMASGENVGHDTAASLTAVTGALLLLTAGPAAGVNRVLLSHPVVVWLGLVSYSLYLWHWPMLSMLRVLAGGEAPVSFRVATILSALALAAVTYYGLERPIRRAQPSGWLVGALLGALAVTGWLGWYTAETGGLPARVPQLQTYAKELDRSADRIPACSAGQRLPCAAQLAERSQQALLVGDSHMHSLLTGFVALADSGELGFGLRASGRGGCAPFLGVETLTPQAVAYGCRSLVAPAILDAATDPRVVWVLLIGRHAARVEGALPVTTRKPVWRTAPWRFEYEGPEGRSFDASQAFSLGLAETVKTLTAAGKHVLFVHQLPELDFDSRQCLRPLTVSWDVGTCSIDRAAVVARQRAYRQVANRVLAEFPQVLQYDPMDLVCDARQCSPFASTGEMLYRDDNHLSVTGARRMAEELVSRMESFDGGKRTAVRP